MGPRRAILVLFLLATSKVHGSSLAIKVPVAPSDGVFDPDNILTQEQREILTERLEHFQVFISVGDKNAQVQLAVAVIDRMTLPSEMDEEKGAEQYARSLHDAWGVGEQTESGGTGALLFLSIYDRIVYISRGEALDKLLTDARVDTILQKMRPSMRQTKFSDGLMLAIDELENFILKGEPTWKESVFDLFCIENLFVLAWIAALLHSITRASRQRRQQRAYVQASSHLSEIDRAQAEALQGRFQATSCPICLDSFKDSRTGSDDQPIHLLRCGHAFDETCWNEWITSGQGNITKCPICKIDLAQPMQESAMVHHDLVNVEETAASGAGDPEGAIRRFQQDRNFRLVQLGRLHPSFITPSQIQRWSSPTYDGSLVRDPVFRQHSPDEVARQSELRRTTGSTSGSAGVSRSFSTYGGGTSSGGRAGRF